MPEQLKSISNQTHDDWHLIVSDDGSQDSTLSLIEDFSESHPGRVTVISHEGEALGACGNFFFLMKSAAGLFPYYAFCDQDDWWEADKLELSLEIMHRIETEEIPALVFTDAQVSDSRLECISPSFFSYTGVDPQKVRLSNLLVQNPISGAGVLVNDALISLASQPRDFDDIEMHDHWIGLVAAAFGNIDFVESATYKYRQHRNNESGAIEMSWRTVAYKARIARVSLRLKERQAARFLLMYGERLDEGAYRLINGFAKIELANKFDRWVFCLRNDISMHGFLRNIGLFISI